MNNLKGLKNLAVFVLVLSLFSGIATASELNETGISEQTELVLAWQEYNNSWQEFDETFADVNLAWRDLSSSWDEVAVGWNEIGQTWDTVDADWQSLELARMDVMNGLGIMLMDSSERITGDSVARTAHQSIVQTVFIPSPANQVFGTWEELDAAWDGLSNAWLQADAAYAELDLAWAEVSAAYNEITVAWTFVEPAFQQISEAYDAIDAAWASAK